MEYTTDGVAASERFDYWREVICDAYLPIQCATPDRRSFEGRIALEKLSSLALSTVSGRPQHISRSPREIGRDAKAYFLVSMQLSNSSRVSQTGRSSVLYPGDFTLYSTTEPYKIVCDTNVDQLIVQLPHDVMLARVPHADMLAGLAVSAQTEMGGLISAQLQQYARTIAGQPDAVQGHLQDLIVDLVATGISTLSQSRVDISRPEQLLLARAKSVVQKHLRVPALDRAFVARLVGMSPRNLARIFARDDRSIAAHIRDCRLAAIAADLIDPRMTALTISEISCKWGMTNFQHLSTLFKSTYGLSPRAYRQTQRPLQ